MTAFVEGFQPPLMGIYAQAAICILSGRPYDSHWEAIFKDLDNVSLFRLSLGSPEMFKVVMTYVRLNQPNSSSVDEVRVGGPQDLLSRIPTDILAEIMQYLPLSSRRKLAKASRKFAALGARELQAGVTRLLSAFGLYHSEVRFMQTATGAILSGRVIPYLVDYTHAVDSLDFYAPDYSYRWVMTFFELATKKKPKYGYQSLLRGVRGSASFLRSDAKDCQNSHWIRVLQSQTDSALDCITYLPFSHLFGAVTAYGAWFGYPDTSAEGETFPNRACMDLGTMLADSEVRAVVDEWIDRYRFSVGSLAWHTCGTDFECPATPRATDDAGCIQLFFPALPRNVSVRPFSVYPVSTAMRWSFFLDSCNNRGGVRQRSDHYESWQLKFEWLVLASQTAKCLGSQSYMSTSTA